MNFSGGNSFHYKCKYLEFCHSTNDRFQNIYTKCLIYHVLLLIKQAKNVEKKKKKIGTRCAGVRALFTRRRAGEQGSVAQRRAQSKQSNWNEHQSTSIPHTEAMGTPAYV